MEILYGELYSVLPDYRQDCDIDSICFRKGRTYHSSLRIEANSLSLDEVKDVIDGRAVLGAAKEIQEVKNAYAAYEEIPASRASI